MEKSSSDREVAMLCCRTSEESETQHEDIEMSDQINIVEAEESSGGGDKTKIKKKITALDIKEWTIELRENDICMDEHNIQIKETLIRKQSEENEVFHQAALKELERREKVVMEKMKKIEKQKKFLLGAFDKKKRIIVKLELNEDEKSLVIYVEKQKSG